LSRTSGQRERDELNVAAGRRVEPIQQPENTLLIYDTTNDRYILARADANGNLLVSAILAAGATVDVTDRWARQLGMIDLQRYLGVACGLANPVHIANVVAGAIIDPRDRNWLLGALDVPSRSWNLNDVVDRVTAVQAGAWSVDVTDRAARLLGVVYGSQAQQILQRAATFDLLVQLRHAGVEIDPRQIRALTAATDVVTVTPQAASVWDVSDRAARLLGIIYGDVGQLAQRAVSRDAYVQLRSGGAEIDPRDVSDRWVRQLGQVDLARVLGAALSVTNPVIAGIFDALGNRMPSMDAVGRRGYVSITDGVDTASVDASSRLDVAPYQTTRTSLRTKPEREDLSVGYNLVAAAGAVDTQLLAAVAGQNHKIFACGYETDAAVRVGFRFGAGNRWGARRTAGPYAQTFPNPVVGPVNTALNFRSEGAVNADVWYHYITEA